MKKKLIVFLLVSILFSVTLPWVSAAPPGDRPPRPPPEPDPPPPPPPPVYDAPVIHGPTYTRDYSAYPSSITVECTVTWDPSAFQRYVWLYVDGTRYTMSYVYDNGDWVYRKIIDVDPFSNHYLYVKAREIIEFDLISLETTSSTRTESRLTTDSYSPTGNKYAIILDFTPLADKTSDVPKTKEGYWAHYNSWISMRSKVSGVTGFDASRIHAFNIEQAISVQNAGGLLVDHLTFFNEHTTSDDFVYIFIASHGKPAGFAWEGAVAASWNTIGDAFDTYDYEKMVVVIEACRSGAGIPDMSGTNRLIITACGGDTDAYHIENDDITNTQSLFTYYFVPYITTSFASAYYYASIECGETQSPQLSVSMEDSFARIRLSC